MYKDLKKDLYKIYEDESENVFESLQSPVSYLGHSRTAKEMRAASALWLKSHSGGGTATADVSDDEDSQYSLDTCDK